MFEAVDVSLPAQINLNLLPSSVHICPLQLEAQRRGQSEASVEDDFARH